MDKIKQIADQADMIINGYAFTREENRIRILNLNNPEKALVISEDGTVLETTMDDIEICIVTDYWNLWRMGMPKYYQDKICGYYLYFTSFCVIECMHVHASDRKLTEEGSAKFFVKADGDTVLQNRGMLNDRDIRKIQAYIKRHYKEMYKKWAQYSENDFYHGN